MRTSALRAGLALLVVYLAAVVVTVAIRHDGARPLFDGFAPPPSYRFMEPPRFFAAGNVKPQATSATIALGPDGSAAAGVATPDGQFVIDLARGAIATRAGATTVAVEISPLAPSSLATVPGPARANGNAYRVAMTYEPTAAPVLRFTHAGTLFIETPELASALLYSRAGPAWREVPSRPVAPSGLSMSAPLAAPGDYLAATTLPELAAASSSSAHSSALGLGIATAAVAIAFFVVAFVLVRRRRRPAPAG
jgi:hypothetical protein